MDIRKDDMFLENLRVLKVDYRIDLDEQRRKIRESFAGDVAEAEKKHLKIVTKIDHSAQMSNDNEKINTKTRLVVETDEWPEAFHIYIDAVARFSLMPNADDTSIDDVRAKTQDHIFPLLRAFIATITTNALGTPIFLPYTYEEIG